MRFHAEHSFKGSRGAIVDLLADPAFYVTLELPDIRPPELIESHREGTWSVFRLRYAFADGLNPILRFVAGSAPLAWVQEVRVDLSGGSGQLLYEAEFDPTRIHGSGEFTLTTAQGSTMLRFDGEVIVAVPGIGRLLEREAIRQLLERFDIEARALDARLLSGGAHRLVDD